MICLHFQLSAFRSLPQYTSELPSRAASAFLKAWAIFFGAILCFLVFANHGLAETLQVPNQYLSIQEAIDASNPGDTIVVASGTYRLYSGNINISKKSLTLKSSFGAQKTIIEGRGGSPVITVADESLAVIDGFTITSIHDPDTHVVRGGGIYCAPLSSPTLINNIITGNHAVFGAGVYCAPSSSPKITNNVIAKNKAVRFGGGIFSYTASPHIVNNRIEANEASSAGAGIFCDRDTPRITNNVIWKNKAKSGGGISCDRSFCTIINNTITKNEAAYGGGIFFEGGAVRIVNNILWENADDLYSGWFSPSSRPDHSNIKDGDFRGVNGNISTNPLFADPKNGDFSLKSDSPCLDAGNPDPMYHDPDGSRNDMGAYGGPKANPGG
jgi:hypothetical protein